MYFPQKTAWARTTKYWIAELYFGGSHNHTKFVTPPPPAITGGSIIGLVWTTNLFNLLQKGIFVQIL